MEILIAVSTSSALAGFSFWKGPLGTYIWTGVGVLAAASSIVKPILRITDSIARKEKTLAPYRLLEHDLSVLCIEITKRKTYDDAIHSDFLKALQRKAELVQEDCGSAINQKIRRKCQDEVLAELPIDYFYVPEET